MSEQAFKLTTGDAMGLAGQQAGDSAQDMHTRLSQLIADMEEDHRAVSGNTLPAFRDARNDLTEAFNGLMRWCSQNGVDLSEGQQDAVTTDDEGQATFAAARTGLTINHV
ncbi:hypothetical protein LX16_3918 [Stackebrandtia albiflava]|uniref:Uncharacterized protein n=1 Tax=Stackebrandtia albiflava TaxID=406432 RepID=A0A562UXZ9_9ACTN|nr:hypothetical protein [Stackebrandtia albiflava]TWJ10501.1 hypothetical protein LX16_3918 [Stackebrandtia albiflava]